MRLGDESAVDCEHTVMRDEDRLLSVLTLTDRPGAERKLYSALWRPRKSARPPWAKLMIGSRKTFAVPHWLRGAIETGNIVNT